MTSFLRRKLEASAAGITAALASEAEQSAGGSLGARPTGPGARVERANRGLSQEVTELRQQVATLEATLEETRGELQVTGEERAAAQAALDAAKHALEDAEKRLAAGDSVMEVDPADVVVWSRANRDARSVRADDPALQSLAEDLRRSRKDGAPARNTVPALLRPARAGSNGRYELIYGRRRHAAIALLAAEGTPAVLRAEVRQLDDLEAWVAMTRENEQREDLSPLEKARSWLQAIEDDKLLTQQALADALGITQASVNQHLALARLERAEPEVFEALGDPREVRRGWAKPLSEALARNQEAVRALARSLLSDPGEHQGMNTAARFRALCAAAAPAPEPSKVPAPDGLRAADGTVLLEAATLADGRVGFAVPANLPPEAISAFDRALRDWLATYRPDLP